MTKHNMLIGDFKLSYVSPDVTVGYGERGKKFPKILEKYSISRIIKALRMFQRKSGSDYVRISYNKGAFSLLVIHRNGHECAVVAPFIEEK